MRLGDFYSYFVVEILLLYIPEDCILEKHPLWDIVSKHRSAFLTKQCYFSFARYAYQQ